MAGFDQNQLLKNKNKVINAKNNEGAPG